MTTLGGLYIVPTQSLSCHLHIMLPKVQAQKIYLSLSGFDWSGNFPLDFLSLTRDTLLEMEIPNFHYMLTFVRFWCKNCVGEAITWSDVKRMCAGV